MRRVTVWAEDHMASRVTKALEDMGADYMSEEYVPPPMPARKVKPEVSDEAPEKLSAASLIKKKGPPPLLGQLILGLLDEHGPLHRREIAKFLVGKKYTGGAERAEKTVSLQAIANALNPMIRFKKVVDKGGFIHANK